MRLTLSVIIASHNTALLLEKTIDYVSAQLNEHLPGEYETIVVDNNSGDGTRDMLKKKAVHTVLLNTNRGFGAANNEGFKKSRGEFLLLLNSDVHMMQKIDFQKLCTFLRDNPRRAGLTVKVMLSESEIDRACHRGFPTPANSLWYFTGMEKLFGGRYHLTSLPLDTIHEIDCPSAAFFLIKRSVFAEVGGFDEDYFFYAEDIDLCRRIKKQGYTLWYYPHYSVLHLKYQSGKMSADSESRRKSRYWFYHSMRIYYDKHEKEKRNSFENWLVDTALKIAENRFA